MIEVDLLERETRLELAISVPKTEVLPLGDTQIVVIFYECFVVIFLVAEIGFEPMTFGL